MLSLYSSFTDEKDVKKGLSVLSPVDVAVAAAAVVVPVSKLSKKEESVFVEAESRRS